MIGRGVEDSREKVQLGDNNNKYESTFYVFQICQNERKKVSEDDNLFEELFLFNSLYS